MSMAEDIGHIKATVEGLSKVADETLMESKRTNGRLSVIERWQARMLGFGSCFVLLSPLFVYEIRHALGGLLSGG